MATGENILNSYIDLLVHNGFCYRPMNDDYHHPDGRTVHKQDLYYMGTLGNNSQNIVSNLTATQAIQLQGQQGIADDYAIAPNTASKMNEPEFSLDEIAQAEDLIAELSHA